MSFWTDIRHPIMGAGAGWFAAPLAGGALIGGALARRQDVATRDANNMAQNFSTEGAPDLTIDPNSMPSNLKEFEQKQNAVGMTPWMGFAQQRQLAEQSAATDAARQQAAAQAAGQRSQLAQKGGLTSGASERLGRQAMLQGQLAQQEVGRQGMAQRAGIGAQGEQMRQAQVNTWGQMADREAQRKQDLLIANQQAKAQMWGTGKLAQAQVEASKPKSGLFGLGIGGIL